MAAPPPPILSIASNKSLKAHLTPSPRLGIALTQRVGMFGILGLLHLLSLCFRVGPNIVSSRIHHLREAELKENRGTSLTSDSPLNDDRTVSLLILFSGS